MDLGRYLSICYFELKTEVSNGMIKKWVGKMNSLVFVSQLSHLNNINIQQGDNKYIEIIETLQCY